MKRMNEFKEMQFTNKVFKKYFKKREQTTACVKILSACVDRGGAISQHTDGKPKAFETAIRRRAIKGNGQSTSPRDVSKTRSGF